MTKIISRIAALIVIVGGVAACEKSPVAEDEDYLMDHWPQGATEAFGAPDMHSADCHAAWAQAWGVLHSRYKTWVFVSGPIPMEAIVSEIDGRPGVCR